MSWLWQNTCTNSWDIFVATNLRSVYDDRNVIQVDGAPVLRWLTCGVLKHTTRQFGCRGKRFKAYSNVTSGRVKHTGYSSAFWAVKGTAMDRGHECRSLFEQKQGSLQMERQKEEQLQEQIAL